MIPGVGMLVSERRRSLLRIIVLPAVLVAVGPGSLVALGGCSFDASGLGGATLDLADGSSTAATTQPPSTSSSLDSTSTSTSTSTDSGVLLTDDGTTTGDPSTGEATTTSDGTDSTTGMVGCMVDDDCQRYWVCDAPECINPDENEGCLSSMTCGPAAPFCASDFKCHDGSEGDPCADGQCVAPLVCGSTGVCQDGNEGDPCFGPGDCGEEAPFCLGDFMCHDGSEDDPCYGDEQCADPLVCGSTSVCQDGDEGDPCFGDADCGPTAPYCPYDFMCHDGSMDDPCYSTQCAGMLVCVAGSNICGV